MAGRAAASDQSGRPVRSLAGLPALQEFVCTLRPGQAASLVAARAGASELTQAIHSNNIIIIISIIIISMISMISIIIS